MRFLIRTFLLTLIVVSTNLFAQYGKISGIAKDQQTGEPLVGVNVILEGTTLGAATNIEGYYVIVNVLPGTYTMRASLIGYNNSTIVGVRTNIDQTTEVNIELAETSIQAAEVVIVAQQPIVQKDVSYSRVNLNIQEVQNLPVASAQSIINLQAGIVAGSQGPLIRGGTADQSAFMLNGLTMRDERDNTPFTGVSFTSIEDIQIQTGGFNAEYGNIRSGLVNVVTKEGKKDKYSVSFQGRYSPVAQKHFGSSPNDINGFWIRPFVDPAVAWTGTTSGGWDAFTQKQYKDFVGWNQISQNTMKDNDPTNDLTPQAAQRLFLWQMRRVVDITKPDYDIDLTIAGPIPVVSSYLGNLRFSASYVRNSSMYVIPLATDGLENENIQFKITSDVAPGMKVSFDGLFGTQDGTNTSRAGGTGMFGSAGSVASVMNNGQFTNSRIFSSAYFCPSTVKRNMQGIKFTHALNSSTFYEFSLTRFESDYNTNHDRFRDTSRIYKFGNSYYVDEAPFGFWGDTYEFATTQAGLRTTIGFGVSRDSSNVVSYSSRFDFVSQLDKYNQIKSGFEFVYSDNYSNYGSYDWVLPDGRYSNKWHKFPVRGALYVQDKLEFEGMVANVGLRLDYSHAGGTWYVFDTYSSAFSAENSANIDKILVKDPTEKKLYLSPRLGVAFPISENSKLFFNYGHFRQMPDPSQLYLIRQSSEATKNIDRISNPNIDLQRTIQYELGFEQNLLDQFLIRLAGFYKDNSLESRLVTYVNRDETVNYSISEPNQYSDVRGFEATVTKNRGNWVQGFINYTYQVRTYGIFGYPLHYQSLVAERNYQLLYDTETRDSYEGRPKPAPYARFNIDFFTPTEFGPKVAGIHLLEEWRLNLLGFWSAGSYGTWTGGSDMPGVVDNVRWRDNYSLDLRLSKNFKFGPVNLQLFVDISNVFNFKYMNSYAFYDGNDTRAYYNSLHLPAEAFKDFPKNPDGSPKIGWSNTTDGVSYEFGEDKLGDYRKGEYHAWDPNATDAEKDEWRKNKSYIDMPNQDYIAFLNPRDIFWGIKFNLELF
ncbi:MAG: TonB-dependent receptor [Ignavibacteriales bacterium]|nr:MAG: TonB-dependent receptor [Ignavibacteriales bacterium]